MTDGFLWFLKYIIRLADADSLIFFIASEVGFFFSSFCACIVCLCGVGRVIHKIVGPMLGVGCVAL